MNRIEVSMKEIGCLDRPGATTSSKNRWGKTVPLCLTVGMALAVCAGPAAAQATYTYTGNPYTLFSCGGNSDGVSWMLCSIPGPNANSSYTATNKVTATLELTDPLPANQAVTDVRTFAGFHLTLSDGQQTATDAQQQGMFAEVGTDATGAINQWRLVINTGYPLNGGVATIDKTTSVFDSGTLLGVYPGNQGYIFSAPGTWNSGSPSPATALANLINLVSNPTLELTSGQINSLTDKLSNTLASIQAGQKSQAINQLSAFINSVRSSQKTGKMAAQTATTLVNAANSIIIMLR